MKGSNGADAPSTWRTHRSWFIAGGFVVLAAGLTFAGSVAAGVLDSHAGLAIRNVSDGGQPDSGGDPRGGGDPRKGGDPNNDHKGRAVPCDSERLIGAITLANASNGGSLDLADNCTYVLTTNQGGNGLPPITQPIRIQGHNTTISRANIAASFRFFTVAAGGHLELCNVTLTGANAVGDGGAVLVQAGGFLNVKDAHLDTNTATGRGGAIANLGTAEVVHTTLEQNSTSGTSFFDSQGGAIANVNGRLTIEDSTLRRNSTTAGAGAVASQGGVLQVKHTRIANNTASGPVGGLYVSGSATVTSSEITDNRAGKVAGGVGVNLGGSVVLRDSVVSGNSTDVSGGGITNFGDLLVEDSKINGNSAVTLGGGIDNEYGTLTVRRSEVQGNRAFGPQGIAAGIFNRAVVTLIDSKVTENSSTNAPGGVFNGGSFTTVGKSLIIDNRPTNCTPSPNPVAGNGCFG